MYFVYLHTYMLKAVMVIKYIYHIYKGGIKKEKCKSYIYTCIKLRISYLFFVVFICQCKYICTERYGKFLVFS